MEIFFSNLRKYLNTHYKCYITATLLGMSVVRASLQMVEWLVL